MKDEIMGQATERFPIWEWVKALATLILTVVVSFKIVTTPTSVTMDFPTLLSLVLALFSVALSALFYFKATDTSNAFYDNTYKFTKDIAELLVKIESGFGERLRHLDEGYTSMRDYFKPGTVAFSADVENTRSQLVSEKQEIEKVRAERDEIVRQLIEQSALQQEEKDKVTLELRSKEEELVESQRALARLNRHLTVERVARRREGMTETSKGMELFTTETVFRRMGVEGGKLISSRFLREKFDSISDTLPRPYLNDMEHSGFFENGLTGAGVQFFRRLLKEIS